MTDERQVTIVFGADSYAKDTQSETLGRNLQMQNHPSRCSRRMDTLHLTCIDKHLTLLHMHMSTALIIHRHHLWLRITIHRQMEIGSNPYSWMKTATIMVEAALICSPNQHGGRIHSVRIPATHRTSRNTILMRIALVPAMMVHTTTPTTRALCNHQQECIDPIPRIPSIQDNLRKRIANKTHRS